MATIAPVPSLTARGDLIITWADVTNADTFGEFEFERVPEEISIEISGTFDSATVVINGGHTTGNASIGMTDLANSAISATAASMKSLLQRPLFLQPSASGGSGSQSVTVIAAVKL